MWDSYKFCEFHISLFLALIIEYTACFWNCEFMLNLMQLIVDLGLHEVIPYFLKLNNLIYLKVK